MEERILYHICNANISYGSAVYHIAQAIYHWGYALFIFATAGFVGDSNKEGATEG